MPFGPAPHQYARPVGGLAVEDQRGCIARRRGIGNQIGGVLAKQVIFAQASRGGCLGGSLLRGIVIRIERPGHAFELDPSGDSVNGGAASPAYLPLRFLFLP